MTYAEPDNARYHARRAKGLCGRNGCEHYSGSKSLCVRHLAEQAERTAVAKERRRDWLRAIAVCGLVCAIACPATADEAPAAPVPANEASRYCARDGESAEARIERLEVALRLAKAERAVNRKRRPK